MQSVGILCPDLGKARALHASLGSRAMLYENPDAPLKRGVCVMPAAYAKGLEFDAVIALCPQAPSANLLYLLSTRALHRLVLICGQEIPKRLMDASDCLEIV